MLLEELIASLRTIPLFTDLDEDDLAFVADLVEPEHLAPDDIVFEQGDESDKFYIIVKGQVAVSVHDKAGVETELTRFGPGEFFGEAGLLKDEPRNAKITAVADTILYSFTQENFTQLLQHFPKIRKLVIHRAGTRTGGGLERYPWEIEDEVTLLVARRHPFSLVKVLPQIIGATLLLVAIIWVSASFFAVPLAWIVSILVTIIWALIIGWYVLDWQNDYLIITNRRVVHIERVMFFSETRAELPMEAVQDVVIDRKSPIAAWLNYAHLRIQTAGGGGYIAFSFLANPEAAQQQILQQRSRLISEGREEKEAAIRYTLQKVVSPPGTPIKPPQAKRPILAPVPTAAPESSFLQRLSEIARVRIERQGEIIWRKHWLVLLSQIARPTLVIAASLGISALEGSYFHQPCLATIALLAAIGGSLWFMWEWADWGNDLYILTPANIIDIDRLPLKLREKRREGGLDRIQDIEVVLPTLWSNIFNIGNVRIKTAAAGGDFSFDKVFDPRGVQRDIFHQLALFRRQQELQQRQRQFDDIAQWFSIYNDMAGRPARPPAETQDIE